MRDGFRGQGSPGYRSRSRSPYRSRSRSPHGRRGRAYHADSPPLGYMGRAAAGGSARAPLGRGRSRSPPPRQYSRSRSRSPLLSRRVDSRSRSRSRSYSGDRSESEEPGQIRTAPSRQRQVKHDTASAQQLQTLQQQLQAEQQARANAEQKMEFLKGKLKEVAERSKSRGNTLVQLVAAVKKFTEAKSALQQAETEVLQVLAAASAYLQEDIPAAPAAAVPVSDNKVNAEVLPQEQEQQPQQHEEQQQHQEQELQEQQQFIAIANGHIDRGMRQEASTAEPDVSKQESGWTEAAPAAPARAVDAAAAGPLRNITFKLKL